MPPHKPEFDNDIAKRLREIRQQEGRELAPDGGAARESIDFIPFAHAPRDREGVLRFFANGASQFLSGKKICTSCDKDKCKCFSIRPTHWAEIPKGW